MLICVILCFLQMKKEYYFKGRCNHYVNLCVRYYVKKSLKIMHGYVYSLITMEWLISKRICTTGHFT